MLHKDRTGLELADVKDFIDKLQKVSGGFIHFLPILILLCCIIAEMLRDLNHAANPIDRRADVVAHTSQELGLRLIGSFCLTRFFEELGLIAPLLRLCLKRGFLI